MNKITTLTILLLFILNIFSFWYFSTENNNKISANIPSQFTTEIIQIARLFNLTEFNASLIDIKSLNQKLFNEYRIKDEVIFVVGIPGSGTTLMRTILDVSSDIYCGYETRFIPLVLQAKRRYWSEVSPDAEGSSYNDLIDRAIRLLIVKIIEKDDLRFKILCVKDPRNVHHIEYLAKLFPNIKVIYMVRDGRGAALSKIRREKKGLNTKNFYALIRAWNDANAIAFNECMKIGQEKCLLVKYENLVTQPEPTLRNITKFINVEFTDKFLHHNEAEDIDFSYKYHNRTHREINTDALNTWKGTIKYDKSYIKKLKMFEIFGYEV